MMCDDDQTYHWWIVYSHVFDLKGKDSCGLLHVHLWWCLPKSASRVCSQREATLLFCSVLVGSKQRRKKKKTNSITNCSEWESALWFKTLLKFPSMQDPSLHSLPHIVKKLQIKRIHWARRDSLMKPKDSLCIYQSCHAFVRSVRHYNLCICWSLWFCLSLFLQHLCAKEIPDDAPKSLT